MGKASDIKKIYRQHPKHEKTAIVTGGARGKRLLAAWFAVVVADIDTEAGEETMQEFHSSDELLLIPADVADAFPGYQPRP